MLVPREDFCTWRVGLQQWTHTSDGSTHTVWTALANFDAVGFINDSRKLFDKVAGAGNVQAYRRTNAKLVESGILR